MPRVRIYGIGKIFTIDLLCIAFHMKSNSDCGLLNMLPRIKLTKFILQCEIEKFF